MQFLSNRRNGQNKKESKENALFHKLSYIVEFEAHNLCEVAELFAPVSVNYGVVLGGADAEDLLPKLFGGDDGTENRVAVGGQKVLLGALGGVFFGQ